MNRTSIEKRSGVSCIHGVLQQTPLSKVNTFPMEILSNLRQRQLTLGSTLMGVLSGTGLCVFKSHACGNGVCLLSEVWFCCSLFSFFFFTKHQKIVPKHLWFLNSYPIAIKPKQNPPESDKNKPKIAGQERYLTFINLYVLWFISQSRADQHGYTAAPPPQ